MIIIRLMTQVESLTKWRIASAGYFTD